MLRLCFLATATVPLLCSIASAAIYPEEVEGNKTRLIVGLIQSYDPDIDKQLNSAGTVVGTEIALDHINADETMLPGYSLHYNFINSPV